MCSSANPTEEALQKSQAAFTDTLQGVFKSAYGAQSQIFQGLSSTLQKMIANPTGYTPAEMAAMRTGATDTVAQQTADATKSAQLYGATHGGADLGSGVQAQIMGQTQQNAMLANSQAQNQITIGNAQQQQQNYWNAITGLTQVGAAYNPTGYANAETGSANATTNASQAVSAEQQQSWNNAFGVVKGISGLAGAVGTMGLSSGVGGLMGALQSGDQNNPTPGTDANGFTPAV